MRIEKTVEIARPVEDVWAFVADARNDPQWCEKVESVEQLAGDGPGPGSSYLAIHRPIPRKDAKELTMDVVGYEPQRGLRIREEDDDAVFNVAYELEEITFGTRLTQVDEIEWKISPLARLVGRIMVSRDLQNQFASLKRFLESR